jgi:hypothetical protein
MEREWEPAGSWEMSEGESRAYWVRECEEVV